MVISNAPEPSSRSALVSLMPLAIVAVILGSIGAAFGLPGVGIAVGLCLGFGWSLADRRPSLLVLVPVLVVANVVGLLVPVVGIGLAASIMVMPFVFVD